MLDRQARARNENMESLKSIYIIQAEGINIHINISKVNKTLQQTSPSLTNKIITTIHFLFLTNGPNKLESYFTLGGTNAQAY